MLFVFYISAILAVTYGRKGFGPGEQDWGYITVRPHAHMFWWLYFTTAEVPSPSNKPLVIWLQGGPGAGSTGFGNFDEIGPIDSDLNARNFTWVKYFNVLFVDNPVGTGFSYTENEESLTKTNKEISNDLVKFLEGFYSKYPEFKTSPLVIAAESYGGKMAVEFALQLHQEKPKLNLLGVILIDAWISPIDSVKNWAPFLLHIGAIDQEGYKKINEEALKIEKLIQTSQFPEATHGWGRTEGLISVMTGNIDFYNVLEKIPASNIPKNRILPSSSDEKIETLMNGQVKNTLQLNQTWGAQSYEVFSTLSEDFMKPVTTIVERLLNETNMKIFVVTGQLDLIVDTPGTVQWVDRLHWSKSSKWKEVPRLLLHAEGINEGYFKKLHNFSLYWVNRAGHMVPADNPIGMMTILDQFFEDV